MRYWFLFLTFNLQIRENYIAPCCSWIFFFAPRHVLKLLSCCKSILCCYFKGRDNRVKRKKGLFLNLFLALKKCVFNSKKLDDFERSPLSQLPVRQWLLRTKGHLLFKFVKYYVCSLCILCKYFVLLKYF